MTLDELKKLKLLWKTNKIGTINFFRSLTDYNLKDATTFLQDFFDEDYISKILCENRKLKSKNEEIKSKNEEINGLYNAEKKISLGLLYETRKNLKQIFMNKI